jgi:hypothetical protein
MMVMDEISIWHLVVAALVVFLWIFPLWRIIERTGRHPALALFGLFPLTALILLWWLAYTNWPAVDGKTAPLHATP